jgi:hypothetical protein
VSEDGDVAAVGAGAAGWLTGVLDREEALAIAPMMISGTGAMASYFDLKKSEG